MMTHTLPILLETTQHGIIKGGGMLCACVVTGPVHFQVIHLPSLREQWHIIACNCLIRFAAAMVLDGELALLYVRLTKSCIRQLSSR